MICLIQACDTVVVVQNQPQPLPTVHTVHTATDNNSPFGNLAFAIAGLLMFCTILFGCWFATIFSVIALMFAAVVSLCNIYYCVL